VLFLGQAGTTGHDRGELDLAAYLMPENAGAVVTVEVSTRDSGRTPRSALGIEKPLSAYGRKRAGLRDLSRCCRDCCREGRLGLHPTCRECRRAMERARYRAKRDEIPSSAVDGHTRAPIGEKDQVSSLRRSQHPLKRGHTTPTVRGRFRSR